MSVVKTQMPGGKIPSMTGAAGTYDKGTAPFDKPHDLGTGGIPLKFYEDHGQKAANTKVTATTNAGLASANGRGQQTGGSSRPHERKASPTNKK